MEDTGQSSLARTRKPKVLVLVFLISIFNLSISASRIEEKGYEAREQAQNPEDEKLFKKYGWTIVGKINSLELILPSTFIHEAGEYPIKLYWAYNNELSKSIGLDFAPYLGEKVAVEKYALSEPWPDSTRPDNKAYGVTMRAGLKLIGAYIHSRRGYSLDCSLERKQFAEITKKSWEEWIDSYIDYDNEIEKRLSTMRPEEIISEYIKASDRHDRTLARACVTRRHLMIFLQSNMGETSLYNEDVPEAETIKSIRLISMDELEYLAKSNPPGTLEYEVKYYCAFTEHGKMFSEDGINYWFIQMKKETSRGGWRIVAIGTGP